MQLDIKEYLNAILKRWWIIALVMVGAAAAGYIYSSVQPRIYQVESRLEAVPSRTDNGLIEAIKKDLTRHASRLTSRDFLARVLADSGGALDDLTPEGISLQTQPLPDNSMILMTVNDTNAERAAALSNAIAREFVLEKAAEAQSNPTTDKVTFRQVDMARTPDRPSQPRTNLNTAAAGLLGLVLGTLMALALFFFDNTLKTDDDVRRHLALNTIGMIPARGRR